MEERKDQGGWIKYLIRFVLSCAFVFPLYAFLYLTFPASIFAFYLVTTVLVMIFTPWDDLKNRFLS